MPREIVGKGLSLSLRHAPCAPHMPVLPDLGIALAQRATVLPVRAARLSIS